MFKGYQQQVSQMLRYFVAISCMEMCGTLAGGSGSKPDPTGDSWITNIRKGHPRLFFNQETWPQIRERALHQEKDWYTALKKRVDSYPDYPTSESQREDFAYRQTADGNYETVKLPRPTEWGSQATETAFVYLITGDKKYLETAKKMLYCFRLALSDITSLDL